jgi:hypothetical protein
MKRSCVPIRFQICWSVHDAATRTLFETGIGLCRHVDGRQDIFFRSRPDQVDLVAVDDHYGEPLDPPHAAPFALEPGLGKGQHRSSAVHRDERVCARTRMEMTVDEVRTCSNHHRMPSSLRSQKRVASRARRAYCQEFDPRDQDLADQGPRRRSVADNESIREAQHILGIEEISQSPRGQQDAPQDAATRGEHHQLDGGRSGYLLGPDWRLFRRLGCVLSADEPQAIFEPTDHRPPADTSTSHILDSPVPRPVHAPHPCVGSFARRRRFAMDRWYGPAVSGGPTHRCTRAPAYLAKGRGLPRAEAGVVRSVPGRSTTARPIAQVRAPQGQVRRHETRLDRREGRDLDPDAVTAHTMGEW